MNVGQPVETQSPTDVFSKVGNIPDEELQRAKIYALLARLMASPIDEATLGVIRDLGNYDKGTEIGGAIESLRALAVRTYQRSAEEEYTELFYGVGAGGELSPYASFYLTGLVYSRPLAELRRDMERIGIEPNEGVKEPEDHIASLLEIMHGLILGRYGEPATLADQRAFFNNHIAPWASKFFEDLEGAKGAVLYMPVGTIGRLFMSIEKEGFSMIA